MDDLGRLCEQHRGETVCMKAGCDHQRGECLFVCEGCHWEWTKIVVQRQRQMKSSHREAFLEWLSTEKTR